MLTKLEIENFKSIHKESIDLGRVNVFIGVNGCGKTNILEALGMASAALIDKNLKNDELVLKGIRVTKPSITFSSFFNEKIKKEIKIVFSWSKTKRQIPIILIADEKDNIFGTWIGQSMILAKDLKNFSDNIIKQLSSLNNISESERDHIYKFRDNEINKLKEEGVVIWLEENELNFFEYFKIYNLSTQILRGIGGTSYSIPGIHGENLDVLINTFSKEEMEELEHHASMISWLDKIIIDQEDALKLQGHKLNLSASKLYFRDKFMQKKNNVFSAENANEGILHALFYLALFISKKTPKLFAIDNIDSALNPGLCRDLIEVLIKLAKKNNKQVLITTHNPAILDGINLHDDEQRIFTVSRNFKGHTKVKRLQIKPDKEVGGHRLKLSELWMRNYLGAIPQHY